MRALALFVFVAAPLAHAASGPCVAPIDCAVGQVCSAATCTWEATDGQTLIDAIVGANADLARDVIFIGDLDAEGGPLGAEIHLDIPLAEDAVFGPRALPKIRSAITITGLGAGISIIDIDADMRLFLLEVDPATNRRPDLLLERITLRDARPGPKAPGAGAVTVRATPTVAPAAIELPVFAAKDVELVSGSGPDAGAIHNDGAPLRLEGCSLLENEGGAGAVSSSTGATILTSVFRGNRGGIAAALAVPAATRLEAGVAVDNVLQLSGCTFEDNIGEGGAVLSLATTTVSNGTFRGNRAEQNKGGAIAARNLRVQAGLYEANFAHGGGGAVAVLDEPPSGPVQIGGAVFRANTTHGNGGGVLHTGAPLVVDQSFFEENSAGGGGGGLAVEALTERNGALPDVRVTASSFRGNVARPAVTFAAGGDLALDERGADLGALVLTATGQGSALLASGPGVIDVDGGCFFGNGAAAVAVLNASISAEGNWWGAENGPAATGDGDLVGAGVTTTGFLEEPAGPCAEDGVTGYPQLFLPGLLEGTATVVTDFRLLDLARGLQVLQSNAGLLVPDTRLGTLAITAEGVDDVEVEGAESFTLSIEPCDGDACAYTTPFGNLASTLTIADNGDGGEGEGEGEGEECAEVLSVSASSLSFGAPDAETGTSTATLVVTNDSPCDIQLLRPFVQSGASQGFSVQPILLAELALAPGKSLPVVVVYTPPEDDTGAEPVGTMRIETAGGTLVEIGLALEPGCACAASSRRGAPLEAGLALVALCVLGRRRRARA